MKKLLTLLLLTSVVGNSFGVEPLINSWILNKSGETSYYNEVTDKKAPFIPYTMLSSSTVNNVKDVCFSSSILSNNVSCLLFLEQTSDANLVLGSIKIFPIPTKDNLWYILPNEATGSFDIRVTNTEGRLVYSMNTVSPTGQIDVSKLSAGNYTMRLVGYNQLYTSNFVKQ